MKIVSNVLQNIEGIQIYYIIGMSIFILFFINVLIKTFRTPKSEMTYLKNSVFENDEINLNEIQNLKK